MTTALFDTLAYTKKLEEAGVTRKQAEVQAEAFAELIDEKIATKADIHDLKKDIEVLSVKIDWLMKFIGLATLIITVLGYFKHG